MPAKLSIHIPGDAVVVRVLGDDETFVVGREPACDVVIAHSSVSRRHATLARDAAGVWQLVDLDSKNGIRVGGERRAHAALSGDGWFAIGDVFCEFERIGLDAVHRLAARAAERRQSSLAWSSRIDQRQRTDDLIADLLRGIVDIAECRRGFLLTEDGLGQMRLRACYAIAPEELGQGGFSGSRGAVDSAIANRRSVFLSHQRDRAWLQNQASVVARGIRSLACLPLLQDGRLLGVAYADTDDEAKVFTDLDAELLEAFVAHAATAIAAAEIESTLADMASMLTLRQAGHATLAGEAVVWAPQTVPAAREHGSAAPSAPAAAQTTLRDRATAARTGGEHTPTQGLR